MKLRTVAEVIKGLRDRMPESFRTLVAHQMINGFLNSLPPLQRGGPMEQKIVEEFHQACALTTDLPFVPHDMQICDSDLAKFCNRWMAVEKFRESGEWKPITLEMNQIRFTMVTELMQLAHMGEQPETD